MPLCFVYTNLDNSAIPDGFEGRLSQCVSEVLSKPPERISIIVQPGLRMCRNNSSDPCLVFQIHSIAVFDEKRNPEYTPKFFNFLSKELSLPASRMTIEYIDLPAHMAASGK